MHGAQDETQLSFKLDLPLGFSYNWLNNNHYSLSNNMLSSSAGGASLQGLTVVTKSREPECMTCPALPSLITTSS